MVAVGNDTNGTTLYQKVSTKIMFPEREMPDVVFLKHISDAYLCLLWPLGETAGGADSLNKQFVPHQGKTWFRESRFKAGDEMFLQLNIIAVLNVVI